MGRPGPAGKLVKRPILLQRFLEQNNAAFLHGQLRLGQERRAWVLSAASCWLSGKDVYLCVGVVADCKDGLLGEDLLKVERSIRCLDVDGQFCLATGTWLVVL